jgi:hypothetical protein
MMPKSFAPCVLVLALCLAGLSACGGVASANKQTDAASGAQGSAGASVDAGSFACGSSTCAPTQICVIAQCGGGPVQCMAETDGGCPTGWQSGSCPSGQFGNQPACIPEPCTPPPAKCVDAPTACASAVDCLCVNQSSICPGTGCMSVIGRQITCAGAE